MDTLVFSLISLDLLPLWYGKDPIDWPNFSVCAQIQEESGALNLCYYSTSKISIKQEFDETSATKFLTLSIV